MPGSSPDDAALAAAEDTTVAADTTPAEGTAETVDGTQAESSPAKAGTMLEAVETALKRNAESPAAQEPGQPDKADPDAKAEGEAEEEDIPPEELKALNWKTQRRFQGLNRKLKAASSQVEALSEKATGYDKIVGKINEAGLDNNELDELVEIGGLLKSKPGDALSKLRPIVAALEKVVGEVLSPELQERVRLGYLTEADAKQLQRANATASLATRDAEQQRADAKAQKEADDRDKLVSTSLEAIERWEKQQADKDPDWHLKRKEVAEQVELAIQRAAVKRGAPYFPNSEESLAFAKDGLKAVNERLARFKPKPNEIRPTTPGGSPRSKPAAKTTLDAINNAL